jgi:hypothetical protein
MRREVRDQMQAHLALVERMKREESTSKPFLKTT